MIADEDLELIELAKAGESNALTTLTNKYRDRVYTVILRMIDDSARSEELTFEVFVRAFRNLKSFRGDARFSSWIYRIAMNQALSERAKKSVEQVPLDSLAETTTLSAGLSNNPDHVYQNLFYSQVIEESLTKLPVHYATALRLFYLKGVGYVEIAELMKIPLGTVKTYLHRGKRALHEIVAGKYSAKELF